MKTYSEAVVGEVRKLRLEGLTYREINQKIGLLIPKSTLSYLCSGVVPGNGYVERIQADTNSRLAFIRQLAVQKNKEIFESKLSTIRGKSQYAPELMRNKQVAK